MRVERFNLKEFGQTAGGKPTVYAKNFLPSGSTREGVPPPPPPPPIYKEEDIKAAEREGYKKGFLEGQKDGHGQATSEQTEVERKLGITAEQFAGTVAPLFADYRALCLQVKQDMPGIAMAIARKVADNALTENAQKLIEETVLRCCETMIHEPKLSITVHESLADALEKRLKELSTRLQAASDMVVVRDAAIPLSDCRVEWANGTMQRDTQLLWQRIERVIEDMVAAGRRDLNKHLDTLTPTTPNTTETKE